MYARLVLSTSSLPSNCIRDIIRLCTSDSPSLSDLSGNAFSNTSSVIIDSTPAGWEYVTSSQDGITLATSGLANNHSWWSMKSDCIAPAGTEKFAVFTITFTDIGSTAGVFFLSGATDVDTVNTTTINRGSRLRTTTSTSAITVGGDLHPGFNCASIQTFHLIATPRFIILYKENSKMNALFEHSTTGIHDFYNAAPFLQYYITAGPANGSAIGPGLLGGQDITTDRSGYAHIEIFNFTEPSTATNYGVFSLGGMNAGADTKTASIANLPYLWPVRMSTTFASNGATRNIVKPIMFTAFSYGLPTCFITGICDVWMTRGGAGTTGDTMTINGDTYTYFNIINSGTSELKQFGLAINTSQTA